MLWKFKCQAYTLILTHCDESALWDTESKINTVNVSRMMAQVVKYLFVNADDTRVEGLIPGSGISPREGHGNPLQYSCLENPMNRGVWWATVHGVSVRRLSMHTWGTNNFLNKQTKKWNWNDYNKCPSLKTALSHHQNKIYMICHTFTMCCGLSICHNNSYI